MYETRKCLFTYLKFQKLILKDCVITNAVTFLFYPKIEKKILLLKNSIFFNVKPPPYWPSK